MCQGLFVLFHDKIKRAVNVDKMCRSITKATYYLEGVDQCVDQLVKVFSIGQCTGE